MAPSSINTSVYSNPSLQKILTSPRYASDQDGQNHNDSALLKWANGLTQPKDKGGLHVSDKNGNYDAFNHGDKATRDQISQYANVLVTGTSTQRALARAQLSSLIPKQLAALQKDTSGLPNANANSNSRAGQELPPGPTFTNGLDVLSKLGALKGKPGYDGFNPANPPRVRRPPSWAPAPTRPHSRASFPETRTIRPGSTSQ